MGQEFHKQKTLVGNQKDDPDHLNKSHIPETVGPYKIEGIIDTGGMSHLYLASQKNSEEIFVVKTLFKKFLSNKEVVQSFLKEAKIIEMADHPNIVKLYDEGEWEHGLYIAMKYIDGHSLKEWITYGLTSLKQSLEIILEIAYALCHLHTHGVIHRDLKPENILIDKTGNIKVIDFGIAQLLDLNETEKKKSYRLIGTPVYMSPEQKKAPESVSYPSDIYSLGIIAYELILGKSSLGHIHISLMPKGLQKIIAKALLPDQKERYQDVVDFVAAISSYMQSKAFEQDLNGISEMQKQVQILIDKQKKLEPKAPNWKKFSIGMAHHAPLHLFSAYHDFFTLSDQSYGIFIANPKEKGAEAMIPSAFLRGLVKGVAKLTLHPFELASLLNDRICQESKESTRLSDIYTMSYLVIKPQENRLYYLSCGSGSLFKVGSSSSQIQKIEASHLALGIDPKCQFLEVSQSFYIGDVLMMSSHTFDKETDELKPLIQNPHSLQQQTEKMLYTHLVKRNSQESLNPLTLITIERKE